MATTQRAPDVWSVAPIDYPNAEPTEDQLRYLLRYAILAPSSHNAQPWLFRISESAVHLYADRARTLIVVDPADRQLHMGCGAALLNLRLALRRFGRSSIVTLMPWLKQRDYLARVRVGPPVTPTLRDHQLFDAIPQRHTSRKPFDLRPVSHMIFEELAAAAEAEGAWLVRLHPDDKLRAAEIIAAADRKQFQDREFRSELAQWLVARGSRRRDGIPCTEKGFSGARSYAAPLIVRTFDRGDAVAAQDHDLATGSPLMVVLGTDGDKPVDWLRAGQAMQRMLLTARTHGLSASFLNQAIELDQMRPLIGTIAGRSGFPQLMLRLGYGPEAPSTRRRSLRDVLMVE